jgi:hypothetical protein
MHWPKLRPQTRVLKLMNAMRVVELFVCQAGRNSRVHCIRLPTFSDGTPLQITFRPTNTIFCQLLRRHQYSTLDIKGVYELRCAICRKVYVGQSGRSNTTRYREHTRYIRTNTPHSAYALHILNTQHEYGPTEHALHMQKNVTREI